MTKKYTWLNEDSRTFLKRGYLKDDETPEERIEQIGLAAEKYLNIKGFADKFDGYMAKGFYSLSSPIWSNFGRKRGLPISCFGSFIPDNILNSCEIIYMSRPSKILFLEFIFLLQIFLKQLMWWQFWTYNIFIKKVLQRS